MKEAFYFSHDYNARNDERIIKLIQKEGWFGYGIYWAIIEKLYEAGGFLEKDYEGIAFDLRTECERIKVVVESGLFKFSNEKFYSKSCLARLKARKGKSEKARQSAFLRWNKLKKDNANALQAQSEGNAKKERKGKERKEYIPFKKFWDLYDKKIGKPKSEKKWNKLSLDVQKKILEYIPKYKLSQPNKLYRKNPETFFNNESWEDEIISEKQSAPPIPVTKPKEPEIQISEEQRKIIEGKKAEIRKKFNIKK